MPQFLISSFKRITKFKTTVQLYNKDQRLTTASPEYQGVWTLALFQPNPKNPERLQHNTLSASQLLNAASLFPSSHTTHGN